VSLPVPNLDDRRFQELVNESKRLVQQRCPEWTDHNVHDPGVTLIELFAWMTEQVIYRLNRVPDRNYVKFLDLLGVKLFPPVAARAPVTFWLAAPQAGAVRIPAGTQIATQRTETEDAIGFTTLEDLDLVSCEFLTAATLPEGERVRDRLEDLRRGQGFACFSPVPRPGDALLIGLTEAVPSNAVTLRFGCRIEGVGVDPYDPPLVWEAWDGERWAPCEGRSRRDRRPEPGRRRRAPRAARPRARGARPAAGRLASRSRHGQPPGPARILGVADDHAAGRVHVRWDRGVRQRGGRDRRGARRLGGRARPALPTAPATGRAWRPAGAGGERRVGGVAGVARGARLRGQRPRRRRLHVRRGGGRGGARTWRPGARRHAAPARPRPAEGRAAAAVRLLDGRRLPRQPRSRHADGDEVVDPVRGARREPAPGGGRCGRRGTSRTRRCGGRSCYAPAAGP